MAKRAIAVWPAIEKFAEELQKLSKSKRPSSQAYTTILKAVEDATTLAKMHVFLATAKDLEEFLELFQSDKPMVPLLHQYLNEIITRKTCPLEKKTQRIVSERNAERKP